MTDAARVAALTPAPRLELSPRCPALGCGALMTSDPMRCLDGTGLQSFRCPACGHRGFQAREGIHSLFGGHHEHVCGYGPSRLTLTVVFSGGALVLFAERGLNPSEAAKAVCRWALLCGQVAGTVQMFLESPALAQCYEYLVRDSTVTHESGRPAAPNGPTSDSS
jgi:hypothetical protein